MSIFTLMLTGICIGSQSSEIEYRSEVESLISIKKLQFNNVEEASGKDVVQAEIANILNKGAYIDYNCIIINNEIAKCKVALVSDEDEEQLREKYREYSEVRLDSMDKINLANTAKELNLINAEELQYFETKELVTMEPLQSYTEADNTSDTVREYGQNIKVKLTNVEKNGFTLICTEDSDEWIETCKLGTEEEYKKCTQGDALLVISNPDKNYVGQSVSLTKEDRDLLERLVMGEAGTEGYEGAVLVAQCIRDTMVYKNIKTVAEVRKKYKYSGRITEEPNTNVKKACAFVFDEGGYAVKHKIMYFYAPKLCKPKFHETQNFIIEHNGHRFFDEKKE